MTPALNDDTPSMDSPAGAVPLTEAQEGLWYAQQLDPHNPIFNTGHCTGIRGDVDVERLASAIERTLAEADALSLAFIDTEDGPRQYFDAARRPVLERLTLPSDAAGRAEAYRLMQADLRTPIDPRTTALARHLLIRGRRVEAFLVGNPDRGSADFRTNLGILRRLSPDAPLPLDESSLERLVRSLRECEICVDALFGTGLARPIEGLYRRVVEAMGASAAHVVAVDLPSGIDADTGRVLGAAVRANRTVTFHRMKRGLELAPEYAGTVTVAPIGIPGPEIPCLTASLVP